jgi:hypothetical protein
MSFSKATAKQTARRAGKTTRSPAVSDGLPDAPPPAAEPRHAAADWREHDLMIRRFQNAGLTPTEIAVVLDSKGLRVRTWHVSETFVRNRLKALGMTPNLSRQWYAQVENCYRRIPAS